MPPECIGCKFYLWYSNLTLNKCAIMTPKFIDTIVSGLLFFSLTQILNYRNCTKTQESAMTNLNLKRLYGVSHENWDVLFLFLSSCLHIIHSTLALRGYIQKCTVYYPFSMGTFASCDKWADKVKLIMTLCYRMRMAIFYIILISINHHQQWIDPL